MTSEHEAIQKTGMPATVDSLQTDFATLGVEAGNGAVGSFLPERHGVGVWRTSSRHHCPSARFGLRRNARDACPLNRPKRSGTMGEPASPRVMVAHHT